MHTLLIFSLILLLTTSISKAQDYVWGEEFNEGDIISAATFNQIFGTLQKINQTITDADLVGTWTCESIYTGGISGSGWTKTSFLQILKNSQITLTASNAGNSESGPYSISTSSPNPISARDSADRNAAFIGTYILKNNNMYIKHGSANSIFRYDIDLISPSRFTATLSPGDATSAVETFSCDSAKAVPAAPTTTTATNAQTTVNVTWTDQSSDETGFKIYRRLSTATEATQLATAVTASPYVDSTITEGQTAYYSVAAYNDNGTSAKSKVVSATLDSINPTVASTSPSNGGNKTGYTVTINFSEQVALNQTIFVHITGGSDTNYVVHPNNQGISFVFNAPALDANHPSYTVTVKSDDIYDLNGNKMAEDYVFTFTDN